MSDTPGSQPAEFVDVPDNEPGDQDEPDAETEDQTGTSSEPR
jgi:hypothetical protein